VRLETTIFSAPAGAITTDYPWILWPGEPDQILCASLLEMGQAAPVLVERNSGAFRLVAGHKRVRALAQMGKEVLALEVEADETEKGLLYLSDNLGGETPSPARRVAALRFFRPRMDDAGLAVRVAPLLGEAPRSRSWQRLMGWLALPKEWDDLLQQEHLPLDAGDILTRLGQAELDALRPYFEEIRWSRGNAIRFLASLYEAARARGVDMATLATEAELPEIASRELSPKDMAETLATAAHALRYPTLSAMEARFARQANDLTSGTSWRITQEDRFETDAVALRLKARTPEALVRAAEELAVMVQSPLCPKLFQTSPAEDPE
jgi:ParB family transcriptional regulator, chromosome partitioning protein